MQNIVDELKLQAHRDSTKTNYYGIWKAFNRFYIRLDEKPNTWDDRVTLFVAFLIDTKKKSSTIKSYISAIRAILKQHMGIKVCQDSVILASLIRACKLKNDVIQTRLPIRRGLLHILISSVEKLFHHPYVITLSQALLATSYFGLFRVGEMTASDHVVKACDVHVVTNKKKMMFVLHTSKTHTRASKPQIIKIVASVI